MDTSFYYCKLRFYADEFIIFIFHSFFDFCFRNDFDHGTLQYRLRGILLLFLLHPELRELF